MIGTAISGVVFEYGMGNGSVRDHLNRTVVIPQLFGRKDIGSVPVYVAVYADDLFHDAGYGSDVVRDHDDCHPVVQFAEGLVQLLFESVVHEIGGFVEDKEFGFRDDGSCEESPLHLSPGDFADGFLRDFGDSGIFDQLQGAIPVFAVVGGSESVVSLQPGQDDFEYRDRECAVEIGDLGHVPDEAFASTEELWCEFDGSGVGHGSQNGLYERSFSAAVWSDNSEEVPVVDLEIDMLEGVVSVVCDPDIAESN